MFRLRFMRSNSKHNVKIQLSSSTRCKDLLEHCCAHDSIISELSLSMELSSERFKEGFIS